MNKNAALEILKKKRWKLFSWICVITSLTTYFFIQAGLFALLGGLLVLIFSVYKIKAINKNIKIVQNGEQKSLEIVDNEIRYFSRGSIAYNPVVIDDDTGKRLIIHNRVHIFPFLVGGKVLAFKFGNDYYFHFQ